MRGAAIVASWQHNARAWTEAVREGRIESRRLGTDGAIVAAALAARPLRVLDVGCGEGWLCRALQAEGILTVGIDAAASLIEAAREAGAGDFHIVDYITLCGHAGTLGSFDLAICNFALLDDAPVPLLATLRGLLNPGGRVLIQTVHPASAAGTAGPADGWRIEDFAAFGGCFPAAMPWYFRTLDSWIAVCAAAGFSISRITEPLHPRSGQALSLLLELTPA